MKTVHSFIKGKSVFFLTGFICAIIGIIILNVLRIRFNVYLVTDPISMKFMLFATFMFTLHMTIYTVLSKVINDKTLQSQNPYQFMSIKRLLFSLFIHIVICMLVRYSIIWVFQHELNDIYRLVDVIFLGGKGMGYEISELIISSVWGLDKIPVEGYYHYDGKTMTSATGPGANNTKAISFQMNNPNPGGANPTALGSSFNATSGQRIGPENYTWSSPYLRNSLYGWTPRSIIQGYLVEPMEIRNHTSGGIIELINYDNLLATELRISHARLDRNITSINHYANRIVNNPGDRYARTYLDKALNNLPENRAKMIDAHEIYHGYRARLDASTYRGLIAERNSAYAVDGENTINRAAATFNNAMQL